MLYVFHGSNTALAADKAHKLINSLCAKKPDAALIKIDADNWNLAVVQEHVSGQGLFSSKSIIFIDRVTDNDLAKEELLDCVESMKESENIFIILERKLNAQLFKLLEKHAEKLIECDIKQLINNDENGKKIDVFALANAFGARNAFKAWQLYRESIERGITVENIIGTLFWKAKSSNMPTSVLEQLVTIYHDGHRGIVDSETAVEKMLLKL